MLMLTGALWLAVAQRNLVEKKQMTVRWMERIENEDGKRKQTDIFAYLPEGTQDISTVSYSTFIASGLYLKVNK
jgi:hypothetical protein